MRKWVKAGERVNFVFDKELTRIDEVEITKDAKSLKSFGR